MQRQMDEFEWGIRRWYAECPSCGEGAHMQRPASLPASAKCANCGKRFILRDGGARGKTDKHLLLVESAEPDAKPLKENPGSISLRLGPGDMNSTQWVVPCPSCGAKALVRSGQHKEKYVVCEHCTHFIGIDVTGNVVTVSHGGISPRGMLLSGWSYFVVGSSTAAALYAGWRWGFWIGVATFVSWGMLSLISVVAYTSSGRR